MTDDDKELVRDLRIDADQCFTKCDPTKKWCKCAFYTRIADRIEALSAENKRLQFFVQAFARHRMEERAAIVDWLRSENGRCDCFAYDDNECACGGRDEYKTWPLEQTAERIEAGEHLK